MQNASTAAAAATMHICSDQPQKHQQWNALAQPKHSNNSRMHLHDCIQQLQQQRRRRRALARLCCEPVSPVAVNSPAAGQHMQLAVQQQCAQVTVKHSSSNSCTACMWHPSAAALPAAAAEGANLRMQHLCAAGAAVARRTCGILTQQLHRSSAQTVSERGCSAQAMRACGTEAQQYEQQ
jgi:hypothetical protein